MTYDEFYKAVEEAEFVERRARELVHKTAHLCRDRLRASGVDAYTLSTLKRELKDWDMVRNIWRTK
jgi:hypothetical protein